MSVDKTEFYNSKKHKFSISNNIDYYNCMHFYISKDNASLKLYLEDKKAAGEITSDEIEFWEGAMEVDTVQDICRTAIVEYHEEDRKNDPLKVKLARAALNSQKIVEQDKERQENQNRDLFKTAYVIGYGLKEIIVQKLKDKDRSVEDIWNSIDDEEMEEKENKLYEKMKGLVDKIKNFSRKGNANEQIDQVTEYYKTVFISENSKIVREYDEEQMKIYEKDFFDKQLEEIARDRIEVKPLELKKYEKAGSTEARLEESVNLIKEAWNERIGRETINQDKGSEKNDR